MERAGGVENSDIVFRGVAKHYGDVVAVENIDLTIPSGAFVALLGPSGCGKTTCLRMIAGFEQPTAGSVMLAGADMAAVPPYQRPINMVFQQYALFPQFDVAGNVAYGLRQARPRLASAEIRRRTDDALAMVQLGGFGRRRVHELSGGQQQRVALARALVNRPKVLLLDEPLAALDKKLRTDMQIELQNLQRELGITFVLVTHDQEEALSMSDVVCVMNKGRIVQMDAPSRVYDAPASRFVAEFVGKTNMLDGTVLRSAGGDCHLRLANGAALDARLSTPIADGAKAVVSIRPANIRLCDTAASPIHGKILNRIFLGSSIEYAIGVPALGQLLVTRDHDAGHPNLLQPGDAVGLAFSQGGPIAFPANL